MNAACGAKTSNGKEAMFEELHRKMNAFWNNDRTLSQTDPEYVKLFSDFAYGEVVNEPGANHPDLDDQTRSLAILAALVGCQGLDAFEMMLPVAYETGLTSVAIKEMIYQATAYCGFGRTLPFLKKLNVFLGAANVHLPLEPQGTTTSETRAQAGEDKQVEIFGDYYTRGGLDTREREMVTLCFLAAQGGCEPQLTAHAKANMVVGNEKAFLIAVVSQCMPYIGYPRTLNAIRCIDEAVKG